jgi:hypothetical protein
MLVRLDLDRKDRWTTLFAGFKILHGPVTSAIMSEAGHATEPVEAPPGPGTDPAVDFGHRISERTVAVTKFIARAVIRDWRGALDDETGEPLPCTPEMIDLVMDFFPAFRAFNERVIDGRIRIDREKKDLPTLQRGTSGSEPGTAPTATDPVPTAPDA